MECARYPIFKAGIDVEVWRNTLFGSLPNGGLHDHVFRYDPLGSENIRQLFWKNRFFLEGRVFGTFPE